MILNRFWVLGAGVIGLLVCTNLTFAETSSLTKTKQIKCEGAEMSGESTLVGAMVGRQEYADGPKQLISFSDGPNIHRTWNGVRAYLHRQDFRVGLFDLRATQLMQGSFDEHVNNA